MQALPAVAENDLIKFGAVITELQQAVGHHFAIAQGGAFTSPEVAVAMQWLEQNGAVAIGQTSWGPTGFCIVDGVSVADSLMIAAKNHFSPIDNLNFVVVSARNSGGDVFVD